MKFTQYFAHMHERPDRRGIRIEWIEQTVGNPEYEEIQDDGRVRRWKRIYEAEDRWLRVVLLEDRETVHNAFFDRSFRGTEHEG